MQPIRQRIRESSSFLNAVGSAKRPERRALASARLDVSSGKTERTGFYNLWNTRPIPASLASNSQLRQTEIQVRIPVTSHLRFIRSQLGNYSFGWQLSDRGFFHWVILTKAAVT